MVVSGSGSARGIIYFILVMFFLTLFPEQAEARRRGRRFGAGRPKAMAMRRKGGKRRVAQARRPKQAAVRRGGQGRKGKVVRRVVIDNRDGRDIFSDNIVIDENGDPFVLEDNSALGGLGDDSQVVVDPSSLGDRIVVRGNGSLVTGVSANGRLLPRDVTQDIQLFNEAGTSRNGF